MKSNPIEEFSLLLDCGRKGSVKVVNGSEASVSEFPWICSILTPDGSVSWSQYMHYGSTNLSNMYSF